MITDEIAKELLRERKRLFEKYGHYKADIKIKLSLEAYKELVFVKDFYDLSLNLYDKTFLGYPFEFEKQQIVRIRLEY